MTVKAKMMTDSINPKAVCKSLNADNKGVSGLSVNCQAETQITTEVEAKSITTILATLDDILSCQITAEKVIING